MKLSYIKYALIIFTLFNLSCQKDDTSEPEPEPEPTPSPTTSITIHVIDDNGGNPVSGALVTLYAGVATVDRISG